MANVAVDHIVEGDFFVRDCCTEWHRMCQRRRQGLQKAKTLLREVGLAGYNSWQFIGSRFAIKF